MLYLDHAASSPLRPEVLAAMAPHLTGPVGNPSSHHTVGEAAAAVLSDARTRVARVLGMRASDVVFTSGGTEANNLAMKGIVLAALESGRRHLITTAIEHESLRASASYLHRFHDVEITLLPLGAHGRVDPDALRDALREDTALISLAHANNEIGTVQDAPALAAIAQEHRIPLHLDAVQSAGWLPLAGIGADAISIAGHKLGAPQGIGALVVRGRVPLEPLLHGGGQERGRRSGTENVAGAVGLATALELAESEREDVSDRVRTATHAFIAEVLHLIPTARLTGEPEHRLPATASFTIAGTSGESVLLELERRGVVSSSGSACAAGSDEPSPVLLAIGIAPEVAHTSLRFTFGRERLSPDAPAQLARLVAESVAAVG